jgi:outer membrane lipoprotein LolB
MILFLFPFLVSCAALNNKNAVINTSLIESSIIKDGARPANFGLIGRVSVRDERQGFSGGIHWQHTDMGDEILLLSPLGQVVAQIQSGAGGVSLTTSEKKVYHAASMEHLTEQVLGWYLPLEGLQYWIQSMNSPTTAASLDRDSDGRVVTIRQDGWEIAYASYFPSVQFQIERPKVLMLNRGDLRIRLVIDQWKTD